jgi:hypothetical protein
LFAEFGDRGKQAESGGAAFEELGDSVGEVGGGLRVVVEVGDSFDAARILPRVSCSRISAGSARTPGL